MMSIVWMPMISSSPRCATRWATPVRKPKEVSAKIPMILCESEPGNTYKLSKFKTLNNDLKSENGKLLVSETRTEWI